MDIKSESFVNPVTDEEPDTRIPLSKDLSGRLPRL
jgi:hypothetical protein